MTEVGESSAMKELPSAVLWSSWIDNGPVLKRRAMRLTRGDREEAEDLLSATLIKAISHVERHETEVREPRAFLMFALKNEYISRLRKKNSERQVRDFSAEIYEDNLPDLADARPTQEYQLWQQDALRRVMAVMDTLPEEMRQVFELRFQEELNYRDIASMLGISEALARKRVQNLRQVLRGALDQDHQPAVAGTPSRHRKSRRAA